MLIASFVDEPGVYPGAAAAYVVLVLLVAAVRGREWRDRRALGCATGIGLFVVMAGLLFLDWLIDDVF